MSRSRVSLRVALFAGIAAPFAACSGSPDPSDESTGTSIVDDVSPVGASGRPACVKVVKQYAEPSPEEAAMYEAGPTKRILYLNGKGGTYKPGYDDSSKNTSSIPGFTAKVSAYEKGNAAWSQLVACVKDQFAAYDIEITDEDPGSFPHIEAVVGGHPNQVGMSSGVGGVSPMAPDCSVIDTSVCYVFTQVLPDVQQDCEVVAHEVGHSLGLDHEYYCPDPMTYLYGCGEKTFQDSAQWCGEYSARQCQCGGQQNTVQHLLAQLGPASGGQDGGGQGGGGQGGGGQGGGGAGDTTPPSVSVLSPAGGAQLPEKTSITVSAKASDDTALDEVALIWSYGGKLVTMSCASPPGGVQCSQQGDTFTWKFPVGSGSRAFSVRATDAAGNQAETPTVTITLGAGGQQPPPPPPAGGPTVGVTDPAAGTQVSPGDLIPVRVTAKDDGWVEQVTLRWKAPSGEVVYELAPLDAETWGIDLYLSQTAASGPRTLRVTATDDKGHETTHPDVVIQVP